MQRAEIVATVKHFAARQIELGATIVERALGRVDQRRVGQPNDRRRRDERNLRADFLGRRRDHFSKTHRRRQRTRAQKRQQSERTVIRQPLIDPRFAHKETDVKRLTLGINVAELEDAVPADSAQRTTKDEARTDLSCSETTVGV